MKFIFATVLAFFLAQSAQSALAHSLLPDNDLWKEDGLSESVADQAQFNLIIDAGYAVYKPYADQNNETLVINRNWTDPTVNANCSRDEGVVTVNMYGGLARRSEINPEGFALVLCHELGHAYGGIPYIDTYSKMAAEGQADYYGAKECVKQLVQRLNMTDYQQAPTDFMDKTCTSGSSGLEEKELCLRGLTAGQALGTLLAVLNKEKKPNYQTPDPTVVKVTQLSYPKTTQCRLDSYFHGVMGMDRPLCWYKP